MEFTKKELQFLADALYAQVRGYQQALHEAEQQMMQKFLLSQLYGSGALSERIENELYGEEEE